MLTKLRNADEASVREAAEILKSGGLVAFPTETVYGLGANAFNAEAVLSVFTAKGRPADNPLIVHIYERSQLDEICDIPPRAPALMDAFWPGPLTILFPRKPVIPDVVTAGLSTVAVRMPSHPVALSLLKTSGLPVAALCNLYAGVLHKVLECLLDGLLAKCRNGQQRQGRHQQSHHGLFHFSFHHSFNSYSSWYKSFIVLRATVEAQSGSRPTRP